MASQKLVGNARIPLVNVKTPRIPPTTYRIIRMDPFAQFEIELFVIQKYDEDMSNAEPT